MQIKETEDGFLRPLRLTDGQLTRYLHYPFCCYPYATAGIKLAFTTDAAEISFTYRCRKHWGWWTDSASRFDVYENGKLLAVSDVDDSGTPVSFRYGRRAAGRGEIVVCFPHNAEIDVKDLTLGNAMPLPRKPRAFLVLGDSISQGLMGNTASLGYAETVARYFDADLLNPSVGGDFFDPEALDGDVDFTPTDVLIALGTNDAAIIRNFDLTATRCRAYMEKVKTLWSTARVTVITPPVLLEGAAPESIALLARLVPMIADTARAFGFTVLHGGDLLPPLPRFYSDHAHPNDLGFCLYAENLIKALQR